MQGRTTHGHIRNFAAAIAAVFLLGGCLVDEEAVSDSVQSASGGPDAELTISGTPPSELNVNDFYDFTPTTTSADEALLNFSVSALPGWASFDGATGRISGKPSDADVGTYAGIRVDVADGIDSATLGPFSITVQAASPGSASLSWQPPLENDDGSALVDLEGYRIYWGTEPGNYPNSLTIDNPSISTYVVENLPVGTYRFVATSFNADGVESDYSNVVTREVL